MVDSLTYWKNMIDSAEINVAKCEAYIANDCANLQDTIEYCVNLRREIDLWKQLLYGNPGEDKNV